MLGNQLALRKGEYEIRNARCNRSSGESKERNQRAVAYYVCARGNQVYKRLRRGLANVGEQVAKTDVSAIKSNRERENCQRQRCRRKRSAD